jgi:hypothetical protein
MGSSLSASLILQLDLTQMLKSSSSFLLVFMQTRSVISHEDDAIVLIVHCSYALVSIESRYLYPRHTAQGGNFATARLSRSEASWLCAKETRAQKKHRSAQKNFITTQTMRIETTAFCAHTGL